eukprot:TRINITY_DN3731_c0_g1_i1.p1 TRINITY_DN3731_c0_g1~~TRINITY_DN3731_c0_g1_i1.p1  ORF type:complete len:918 (+),score=269.31 TRINITY_DN3731_c0_g1_i1:101-2854(+)
MPMETRARGRAQSSSVTREPDLDSSKGKRPVESKIWNASGLFADVVGGFVSWSLLTHIVTLVFFFPLVKMAYTGWEVFLAGLTVTGLLGKQWVRDLTARYYWAFRAAGTIGLLSLYLSDHEFRIGLCAVGLIIELTGVFGVWLTGSDARRERSAYGFAIGLIALVVLRLGYFSYNPVWLYTAPNLAAAAISLVSAYLLFSEHTTQTPATKSAAADGASVHWTQAGAGVCGAVFTAHNLFSSHNVISRWADIPTFPHGVFVVISLIVGLLFARHSVVSTPQWWFATAGLGWLLFAAGHGGAEGSQADWFPGTVQLLGGMLLGVYATSVWLQVADALRRTAHPGRALLFGMLAYLFMSLWTVYVVAYKFMDPVLGPLLGQRLKSMVFTGLVLTGLAHVSLGSGRKTAKKDSGVPAIVKLAIGLLACGALAPAVVYRLYNDTLPPANPTPSEIKPMIWAIHFGYDNFGAPSIDGLAHTMETSGANIIGIVETDGARIFLENNDFTEYLGGALHFNTDYGPATSTMTWGCAMLTVFPILRSERIVLPSPFGELACLIDADVDVNGTSVNVIVTHFGNTEDVIDLDLQTQYLSDMMAAKREKFAPTIMIGYLTTPPYGPNWMRIMNSGILDTLPSHDRYCEYVLYKDLKLTSFVRIDKGNISDTEAQVATFSLLADSSRTLTARHQKSTPGLCDSLKNDTVGCQAAQGCGWCQVSRNNRVGGCLEPTEKDACLAFGGYWLGPEPESSDPDADKPKLIEAVAEKLLHFQLDGSYGDSLVRQLDDSYLWTIPRLEKLDRHSTVYDSPVFPAAGHYWRAKISLPWYFRSDNRTTWLGAYIERVTTQVDDGDRAVSVDAEITLLNQQNSDLNLRNTFAAEFSKGNLDRGYTSFQNWHALNTEGFKKEDSTIQLVFKISERFRTHLG